MFQPRGSCLGSERCFGGKVVVEAAVSEACGLHQIGHADAVEAMLAKQSASCLDDALAILCGLLFGQFHCASSRKMNSLLYIIMLSVITLYIQRGRLSLLRLRSPGYRWASCSSAADCAYAIRISPRSIMIGACRSIPWFPVTKRWARLSTSANKPGVSKLAS